ncbi:S66 peptidase family protein [Lewinella cohaerens]|uniref:S66 peptidase family protein n=1 Tax=Lewinella cohaerens TaxID=70995 RepID=UPI00036C65DC|nr:LD-carboxypeptidase [Lewinella cohaerens]
MNRRTFNATLLTATAGLSLGMKANAESKKPMLLPPRLRPGDQVGLITPASYIEDEGLEKAVKNIESLGLKPVLGKNIRADYGSLAGSDGQRLADFHQLFSNPEIKGVWCARGGYGCARLLPKVDFKMIRRNPKVFVGYSDVTALHIAIQRYAGLVTYHGPVGSSTLTDYTRQHLEKMLFSPVDNYSIDLAPLQKEKALEEEIYTTKIIRPGVAEGRLVGGNLTLLASALGTKYTPKLKNKILFMEDVGEKPYRIDRMLTSLRQAWPLSDLAGIAMGVFAGCERKSGSRSLSLLETIEDRLGDLDMPIIYGLSFGHVDDMCTLPMGIKARLDTTSKSITLLEPWIK